MKREIVKPAQNGVHSVSRANRISFRSCLYDERGVFRATSGSSSMSSSPLCPAADLLVRRLFQLGVREVFGYPGGQLTPIYDALHRERRIRHYLARHEQAAAFMADGYARST